MNEMTLGNERLDRHTHTQIKRGKGKGKGYEERAERRCLVYEKERVKG